MSEFLSSSRGRAALIVAAVVIVLGAGGGYYFWSKSSSATAPQGVSLAEAGVCNAVVARARDYGVLPPDAQKSGRKSVSDSDPNRVTCNAQADNATFTLIADVPCDNAKDDNCLLLQKVTKSDGVSLYDTHNI